MKQYNNGYLQIQGYAGALFKAVLDCLVPRYNLHYPKAQLTVETFLQSQGSAATLAPPASFPGTPEVPLPYLGTDESGKGDYFGPMVVAAVLVDPVTQSQLEALGVKDSKLLSDKRCRELAGARTDRSARGGIRRLKYLQSATTSYMKSSRQSARTSIICWLGDMPGPWKVFWNAPPVLMQSPTSSAMHITSIRG